MSTSFKELTKELSRDLSFRILDQVHVEHGIEFIPNAYQLFPERYVAANRGNHVLCIDYDMGAGKTLSAALAIERLLRDSASIEEELVRSGNTDLIARIPRPYVIGNWSSVEAFEDELMRPGFGILSEQEFADYVVNRSLEDSSQYEHLRAIYSKRIRHRVRMASYQKMFNRYFRGASTIAVKDEGSLQLALDRGEIVVDPTIAMELSNSVLIVDELQMLYSGHGWNTYGFLLDHIRQNPDIPNLTTILLSGTFINSSPVEMIYLYNLIRDKGTPRVAVEEYFDRELIGIQTYAYTPKKAKDEELVRLFDGKVVSYRISPSKDFPEIQITGELLSLHVPVTDTALTERGKGRGAERGLEKKFEWLRLTRCFAPKYQWEQYVASYETIIASSTATHSERASPVRGGGSLQYGGCAPCVVESCSDIISRTMPLPDTSARDTRYVQHLRYGGSAVAASDEDGGDGEGGDEAGKGDEDKDEDEEEGPLPSPGALMEEDVEGEGDIEDDMMAHDFALPPHEEWPDYHVEQVKGSTEVYSGTWLSLENLKNKFGAIPATFVELLLGIVRNRSGEKVVAHHRRLEKGGLLQYAEALKENGFTLFGEGARETAICIVCGKAMSLHARVTDFREKIIDVADAVFDDIDDIDDEAAKASAHGAEAKAAANTRKEITDHKFTPATFALLTGRLSFAERQKVILTYNSSSNLYNHRIMCLLISGVGERGITLKATNYGVALDVFPGLPAWRQFLSRIARHGTHKALPPNKQWAKILTMVLSPPSDASSSAHRVTGAKGTSSAKGSEEGEGMNYSRDEFRYYVRETNDRIAVDLWDRLRRRTVNCPFIPSINRGAINVRDKPASSRGEGGKGGEGDKVVACAWTLGQDIDHSSFDTFYHIYQVHLIKKIIRRSWAMAPIQTLANVRSTILSDVIRKSPHNMSFSSDVAICEAIVELCEGDECQLYVEGSPEDISVLRPSDIRRDDVVIIRGVARRGPRALTIFTAHVPRHVASWVPLGRELGTRTEEEIQKVVSQIGAVSGYRERTSLFDRIVDKPGLIAVIRKDFEIEGPLYKLLKKSGGIVWEGDDESPFRFAHNRLAHLDTTSRDDTHLDDTHLDVAAQHGTRTEKKIEKKRTEKRVAIGFILGIEYHSYKGAGKGMGWEKRNLPIIDASNTEQWDICAIFSPGSATAHGRWHTRTKIRPRPSTVEDLRKVQSGMGCLSISPAQLSEYCKLLGIVERDGKTEKCALIENALLRRQLSKEGKKWRFIYTPFEAPPTASV